MILLIEMVIFAIGIFVGCLIGQNNNTATVVFVEDGDIEMIKAIIKDIMEGQGYYDDE